MNTEKQSIKLSVSIGEEIAKLLPLKFGKDGRTNTSWGTKSLEGLGNCILRIVEEQRELLSKNVLTETE